MAEQADVKMEEASAGVLPVAVLIDELRNEDMQIRLNSIRKLSVISNALGPVRTREELIPYLTGFVDDEDDILLALAEELGKFVPAVGGAEYAHALLKPLEALCSVEETVVRQKAVASIISVGDTMTDESVTAHIFPMVERLSTGEWFSSRMSACGLYESTFPRVDERMQTTLKKLFVNLCRDETPMVRRAACTHIGKFARVMDTKSIKKDILTIFSRLSGDEQDSVRLLTVENCICIAKLLKKVDLMGKILPIISALCKDKSWRVRYMVADQFCSLCDVFGEAEARKTELPEAFVRLLLDNEPEVRTAASNKLANVAKQMGPDITLRHFMAPIRELVGDNCQYVRAALAKVIMQVATVGIREEDVNKHFLPLFLQLLRDQSAEVRLNVISKLDTVNEVIGIDRLHKDLLAAISELALDTKWRVRLAIIEHVPLLASQLKPEFFEQKLNDLCMESLGDQVFSIRQVATGNCKKLTDVYGVEWAKKHVLPGISNLGNNPCYLYRMTALKAVMGLAPSLGQENTTSLILPIVIGMTKDAVPNVRFNAALALREMKTWLSPESVQKIVVPQLEKLSADKDTDVRYFSSVALGNFA